VVRAAGSGLLDLRCCALAALPDLQSVGGGPLKVLDVRYNALASVHERSAAVKHLVILNAAHNRLERVEVCNG